MKKLLGEIRDCVICKKHLPLGPRPILSAHAQSKIIIIGQAPGSKVHQSGVPWQDASGIELRRWLNVTEEQFYNEKLFALMPMGFCYPGKSKTGDTPPRPECAPQWHERILSKLKNVELILLIGQYSQNYYLKEQGCHSLTQTVKTYRDFLPQYFPLPHPSPRNRIWRARNPWFEKSVIPTLQKKVLAIIR